MLVLIAHLSDTMGAYLTAPLTDKESTDETNEYLSCGASQMQGWRMSQEVRFFLFSKKIKSKLQQIACIQHGQATRGFYTMLSLCLFICLNEKKEHVVSSTRGCALPIIINLLFDFWIKEFIFIFHNQLIHE